MKEVNKINSVFFGIIYMIIVAFVLMIFNARPVYEQTFDSNVYDFSNSWEINGELSSLEDVEVKEMQTNVYVNKIPDDFLNNCLSFFTINSYVKVYLDKELIYTLDKTLDIGNSPGSLVNFVRLPKGSAGKEIKIEVTSAYDRNSINFLDVYIGNYSELILKYFNNDTFSVIINILLLIIGLLLIGLFVLFKNKLSKIDNVFYLGIFSITFSLWSLSEIPFMHLFLTNGTIKYYLCYFSLYLFPLAFGYYILSENVMGKIYTKFVNFLVRIHCIWCIIMFFGHLFRLLDLTKILTIYHILLITEIVFYGFFIANIVLKIDLKLGNKKNPKIKKIILGFILSFLLFLDIVRYYNNQNDAAVYSRIIILLYTIIIVNNVFRDILQAVKMGKHAKEYKTIAYYDSLTGLNSINAFNNKKEHLKEKSCCIIFMDINYLKYYNDVFGHEKGDELLITSAKFMKEIFGNHCYRIGGDEFVAVLEDYSKKEIEEMTNSFQKLLDEFNSTSEDLLIQIAHGTVFKKKEDDFEILLKEADALMYKNKKRLKENNDKIKEVR